jgi:hypothetical protein
VTKVATIHPINPDIAKVIQNEVQLRTNKAVVRKEPELPWRITPSTDSSNIVKHYLMLSKIRLTCKFNCLKYLFYSLFIVRICLRINLMRRLLLDLVFIKLCNFALL